MTARHRLQLGLAVLVGTMLSGCLSGQLWYCREESASRLDSRQAIAMKILRTAKAIESIAVSDGGEPSCYVMAYRRILQSPRADRRFKRLLTTAETPAAQLYALAGLYWTDSDEFGSLLPGYLADSQTRVSQLNTCVGSEETLAAVAEQIAKGYWPKQWANGLSVEGP